MLTLTTWCRFNLGPFSLCYPESTLLLRSCSLAFHFEQRRRAGSGEESATDAELSSLVAETPEETRQGVMVVVMVALARQHCWQWDEITTNPRLLHAVHAGGEDRLASAQSKYPVTLCWETGRDSRELTHRGNVFPDLPPAGCRAHPSCICRDPLTHGPVVRSGRTRSHSHT